MRIRIRARARIEASFCAESERKRVAIMLRETGSPQCTPIPRVPNCEKASCSISVPVRSPMEFFGFPTRTHTHTHTYRTPTPCVIDTSHRIADDSYARAYDESGRGPRQARFRDVLDLRENGQSFFGVRVRQEPARVEASVRERERVKRLSTFKRARALARYIFRLDGADLVDSK